jgi:hypothetical protein
VKPKIFRRRSEMEKVIRRVRKGASYRVRSAEGGSVSYESQTRLAERLDADRPPLGHA